jgi:transcription elongation factor SPT6
MAQKIGIHFAIRQYIRSLFLNESSISTSPTPRGASVIDITHPYFIFKHIQNKPLSRFETTQFLQLADAEQSGLINITFTFKNEKFVLDRFSDAYCSDSRSSIASEWNEFRRDILKKALNDHLIPYASKWMIQKLRTDGEEVVLKQIEEKFYHKANMAPFRSPSDPTAVPKILALTCGRDIRDSPNVAVFANSSSQISNTLTFGDLRNDQSKQDLYNFISKCNPDAAVISGLHYCTKRFYNDISKIVDEYSQNNSTQLPLFWQTDETARLYQNSKEALADFPNSSAYLRYCVSLARYCQNPVNEYAALGSDLTRIHLHPLQKLVNPNRLQTIMDRVLINVINETGVLINQTLTTPYKSVLLNYVSGLGPRKAQHIIKKLTTTTETPNSRTWFLSNKALTKSVFFSCSSVLKIENPDDVLDGTRIHPEDYALARKMAADALEIDEEESNDSDNPSYYVQQLMNTRNNNLSELNLDEFSKILESYNQVRKNCTLSMICDEIQNPYYDHRSPYLPASPHELFAQLTGESPSTLHEDMRLPVEVIRQTPKFFICRTDSGLDGFLSHTRIPHGTATPYEGQIITCVVTRVDLNRFSLELSLLPEDFSRAKDATWLVFHSFDTTNTIPIKDEYFREPDTSKPTRTQGYDAGYTGTESRSRSNGANGQISNHALFKQFNFQEAEQYLLSKSIGDLVIRPSSSGNNHLSISWKMHDSIYQHLNVSESNEPASTNINRSITIGGQRYENIEDMITSYINPCLMIIRQVTSHPKYRDGGVAKLKEHLQNIALQHPSQSVYGLCLSNERPGYVVLAYKINASSPVQDILVKITPGQFRLNNDTYSDITKLINGFKVMVSQRNRRN